MKILLLYLILLVYFVVWFIISELKKNNGLVDIAWGLGFVVTSWSSYFLSNDKSTVSLVLNILVTIWGARLSFYLFKRNWSKEEDFRYKEMKLKWQTNLKINTFFKVFVFQSLLNFVIATPIIIINFSNLEKLNIISIIIFITGILVFTIGFLLESISDYQLRKFKSNTNKKEKVLKTGLWAYSRHPNYFGEGLLWIGIGIIGITPLSYLSLLSLLGPLIINYLLMFVSGVPILERRYKDDLEYQEYSKNTPIYFPKFKKN